MKTTVVGLDKLQKLLKKMPKEVEKEVSQEFKIVGVDLQGRAERIAPHDQGDLAASGFTEAQKMEVTVGFTEEYALRQHENLTYRHSKGKKAKYLENPYKQNLNRYIKEIGNAIKKAVER